MSGQRAGHDLTDPRGDIVRIHRISTLEPWQRQLWRPHDVPCGHGQHGADNVGGYAFGDQRGGYCIHSN